MRYLRLFILDITRETLFPLFAHSVRHVPGLSLHRTCRASPDAGGDVERVDGSRHPNPVPAAAERGRGPRGGRRERVARRRREHRAPGLPAVVLRRRARRGEDVQL